MKWLCYMAGITVTVVLWLELFSTMEVGFLGDEDPINFRELIIATLILYAFPLAFFWQYLETLFSKRASKLTYQTSLIAAGVPLLMIGSWLIIGAFQSISSLLIMVVCAVVAAGIAVVCNQLPVLLTKRRG